MPTVCIQHQHLLTAFPKSSLGWSNVPTAILNVIVQFLSPEDRKSCTMICKHWHDVVFNSSLNHTLTFPLAKYIPGSTYELFNGFLPSFQRSYRSVEISWINYPDIQYLFALNKLFEMLPHYALKKLTINATPDETLGEFFERHRPVLSNIRELHVYIGSPYNQYPVPANDDAPLETKTCFINMHALECLEWTEASLGNISHGRQFFIINAPVLAYIKIQTLGHWNCYSVLNIKSCPKLKNVILDLPNRIWRTFQRNSFEHLSTLNLTTISKSFVIENIPPIQYDQLFGSMKLLEAIKITGVEDAALLAVCEHCPLVWSIELSRFCVNFNSFVRMARWKNLQNINLTLGQIIGCKGRILCESLKTLFLHEVALVNGEYKMFPLELDETMKSKMRYSKRNNDIICYYSTI